MSGLAEIKRSGAGLVEVHTHPGSRERVRFSSFDEDQLPRFARYFSNKLPGRPFGALVLGNSGYEGRYWNGESFEPLNLEPVGERRRIPAWASTGVQVAVKPQFDRQVRALGVEGQRCLSALRVGVVGLGGTGSQVVQQLSHLGVRKLILVDADRVEDTNLPRLAGVAWWDVLLRRKKSAVAKRLVRRIRPQLRIQTAGDLRSERALTLLAGTDLIVGCVDNDGARLVLSELASAHLIPYLDIGVGIERENFAAEIGGRVGFHVPGGPCLACADELDFAESAEDLEPQGLKAIRVQRGYATDRTVEPALMPLNTVLVGLAMTELLAYVTGVRSVIPFSRYDLVEGRIVSQNVERNPLCVVCSSAAGMGDSADIARYSRG
jgi:molybdopterin/thiamine biosynthesis adenylyltransferase